MFKPDPGVCTFLITFTFPCTALCLTVRGSGHTWLFWVRQNALAALNRKETLKPACGFGPQPWGNLWATGQGWCRARIPGVPILPSWLSPWLPACSGCSSAGLAQDRAVGSWCWPVCCLLWLEKHQERKNCPLCLKPLCFEELLAGLGGEELSLLTHLQWLCPANTHCLALLKILPLLLLAGQR